MENASKALIIAGSVLIALMIIGALVLMFSNLTSYQETNTQNTREAQITEFNNQYTTYARNNVRGSDLYSLLNKVVDYNRRKSTEGTAAGDEGKEIAYMPITISFSMDGKVSELAPPDGRNELIKKDKYTQSSTSNVFYNDIAEEINRLENITYTSKILTNLCTALTKVFIDEPTGNSAKAKKLEAINNFNSAYGTTYLSTNIDEVDTTWNKIKSGSTIRKDVYEYYEYIQFKRAYFDYIPNEDDYDKNTGRIVKLEFKFNGKFN